MNIRCSNCFQSYDDRLDLCPACGYAEEPPEAFCLTPGTSLAGRYCIGRMVGMGGFGIIYRAWDEKLGVLVAVKEYFPGGMACRLPGTQRVALSAPKQAAVYQHEKLRFLDEARNMARFNAHPNIVHVTDFFEENDTAYIVMEYLTGKTLYETIQARNEPLPADRCIQIAQAVCHALRDIHAAKILHRDVSPDNIFLCRGGAVKLIDFGTARFAGEEESRLTIELKPGFAPPEQYEKVNRQGPWTDIYALGATLYFALTGQKPDESTNRKAGETLTPPDRLNPGIPSYLSQAIVRSLALEPQYRYQTVDAFERAILNQTKAVSVEEAKKRAARRRAGGILGCAAVLLACFSFFFLRWYRTQSSLSLQDARLALWYQQTGDSAADAAKQAGLEQAAEAFTQEYPNVRITVSGKPREAVQKALQEGAGRPSLAETTGLGAASLAEAADLSGLLRDLDAGGSIIGGPSSAVQYPTGLAVPVVYLSGSAASLAGAADLSGLAAACSRAGCTLAVGSGFCAAYLTSEQDPALAAAEDAQAVEKFLDGSADVLLADSASYFSIQSKKPGLYRLTLPENMDGAFAYTQLWSVFAASPAEKKAAERFLAYLRTDAAQDGLDIQNHSGSLPVNWRTLQTFSETYDELQGVCAYLDRWKTQEEEP